MYIEILRPLFDKWLQFYFILNPQSENQKTWIMEVYLKFYQLLKTDHCTEVGRAFLIHLKKWFLDKVFIRIKTARKFKFYVWMIIFGSKNVKKGQKFQKKTQIGLITCFPKKNLSWLFSKTSIARKWWKKIWCHYITLRVIFSHLVKLTGHFRIY